MAKTFITAAETAEMLGLPSPAAFLAKRAALEDGEAFPLPMPHRQRPMLWRRDQVEAWIDRQGRPRGTAEAPLPLGGNVVRLMDMARTA